MFRLELSVVCLAADPTEQSSTSPTARHSALPPSSGPRSNKPTTPPRWARLAIDGNHSQPPSRIRMKRFRCTHGFYRRGVVSIDEIGGLAG
jgi:hypothetical protein